MWFTTQYGGRVPLDVEPVPADSDLARYRIDYAGLTPVAVTVRKQGYYPDHPEADRYSTHFDTCSRRASR